MSKILIHIASLLFSMYFVLPSLAQPREIIIKQTTQKVQIDVLGQIYTVNGSEVSKYSAVGNFLYRYSNNHMGSIHSLDVENPLKVMLFYRESNLILFLDAQLAEIGSPGAIPNFTGFEADEACSSTSGNFWLFQPELQQVNHFTITLQPDWQTPNLGNLIQNELVIGVKEKNHQLFLMTNQKVLVFDSFGNFETSVATPGAKNGFLRQPSRWVFYNDSLNMVNLQTKEISTIPLPNVENPIEVLFFNKIIVYRCSDYIKIFPFPFTNETYH